MSVWTERKREFYRQLVSAGLTYDKEQLKKLYPLGWAADDEDVSKWFKNFYREPKAIEFSAVPRLVNHFKQGADPEFILTDRDGLRVDAQTFHMKAGRAYGADNNGRLAEIRPYPAKYQLAVLASILDTFRWMAVTVPNVYKYNWECGAFLQKDGLGGHIHMGRRRKASFKAELRGLDKCATELEGLSIYPEEEVVRRRAGDQFGQLYGRLGDYRKQSYGYEYRTFPSWLDSPWMAYFHLVLAKLATHDPELFNSHEGGRAHIENILRYYKGLDDDVLLAYVALKRLGVPKHIGGDFRLRWGIDNYDRIVTKELMGTIIPGAIPGSAVTVEELFNHLAFDKPLHTGHVPSPTWTPTKVPEGLCMVLDNVETRGVKGIGEMLWDVCTVDKFPVAGRNLNRQCLFQLGAGIVKQLPADWKTKLPKGCFQLGGDNVLWINNILPAKTVKPVLLGGAFPLWDVKTVTPETLVAYKKRLAIAKVEEGSAFVGKVEVYK